MKHKNKIIILSLMALSFNKIFSFTNTNFFKPYDINYRVQDWPKTKLKVGATLEYGESKKGRSEDNSCNVLQVYNPTQSSLAMLMGSEKGTDLYNLANYFLDAYGPATDDGVRGNFYVTGKFQETDLNLWAQYRLPITSIPGCFDLYFYLPVKNIKISDTYWKDLTKNVLFADQDVHLMLTDNLNNFVKENGNLDLGNWSKIGFGDLVLMLRWFKDFKQLKENLKNVKLSARAGLSFPTGEKKNENKTFSFALGNDGAWAIPLTAGIDLDFIHHASAGLEFEMLFTFDKTKTRRLMTDYNQTEFLLLNTGSATRNHGFSWKFNLYLQAKNFLRGLSVSAAYQFYKHDSDKLIPQSNKFNYDIVNYAQSLQEWGYQNIVFKVDYDFFKDLKVIKPQISFFYKMPISGKRVINPATIGGQLTFSF